MTKLEKELKFRLNELNSTDCKAMAAEYILLLRKIYREKRTLFTEEIISNINYRSEKFRILKPDFRRAEERLEKDTLHDSWEKRCNSDGSIKRKTSRRNKNQLRSSNKNAKKGKKSRPSIPDNRYLTKKRAKITPANKPTTSKYNQKSKNSNERKEKKAFRLYQTIKILPQQDPVLYTQSNQQNTNTLSVQDVVWIECQRIRLTRA